MEPGAPPFIRLDVRVCLPSVPRMSITQTKRLTARPVTALVPDLGLNYPNWLMGPFDLGNGFFYLDQNRLTGTGKIGPTVALIDDNLVH